MPLRGDGQQDTSTFDALVSPRVFVEVGSSAPIGLDEWRANLEVFYRGFPDGRHVIESCSSSVRAVSRDAVSSEATPASSRAGHPPARRSPSGVIHIDRFQGDMVVSHRGQMDMHGLFAQLDGD